MAPEACRFQATPMDVTVWLRGLVLEQYGPAFRDHDIDREVLRRLTGEDLRELGVASIGHRRRLLDAITALTDAQPVPKAPLAPLPAPDRRNHPDMSGWQPTPPRDWARRPRRSKLARWACVLKLLNCVGFGVRAAAGGP
jgi:hypothetical protein